ncbi:MAG: LamG-like jellyroll fold domain-containing protein [Candidatus Electryonea clarkiae]|nr:LamG-like jellyroll fold domain-containing protein [Candidatus Electryonea clarkiae]MDP8286462.1 LamG-like jellyroll fold domain-containing protein [Candidatus Electryonea clarkiae]
MKKLNLIPAVLFAFLLIFVLSCQTLDPVTGTDPGVVDSTHDNPDDPGNPDYEDPDDTTGTENHPPEAPFYPNPADTSVDIATTTSLSWQCYDQDTNDTLSYNVYFGEEADNPELVSIGRLTKSYTPEGLETSTTYYWKILAKDNHDGATVGDVWSFTTAEAGQQPPAASGNPYPEDNAENTPTALTLSWTCTHPDELQMTYSISFGTEENPGEVVSDQSETSYETGQLNFNTTYYWQIIARDENDRSTEGSIWSFTTAEEGNQPPDPPSGPEPSDGAQNVSRTPNLLWNAHDQEGDPMTFTIFLGPNDPPVNMVSQDQTSASFQVTQENELPAATRIYWRVIAKDDQGSIMQVYPGGIKTGAKQIQTSDGTTPGPVWSFVTVGEANQPPEEPGNPSPANNAQDINPIDLVISWECSDPEEDRLTYTVFFGTDQQQQPRIAQGLQNTQIYPSDNGVTIDPDTRYYWKIVAGDNHDNVTEGQVWTFVTSSSGGNQPPDEPSNPNPADGAENIPVDEVLSWQNSDPENDPIDSDIYFGTDTNPPFVHTNAGGNVFRPQMEPGMTYYWKIIAIDDHDNETEGHLWTFTTEEVVEGVIFETSFEDDNVGELPEWGVWEDNYTNGITIEVSDDEAATGEHSLYFNDPTDADDGYINCRHDAISFGRFEYKVLMGQRGDFSQSSWMDDGGTMFLIQFTSNGSVVYADDEGWQNATTYNTNEWVEVAIEFDIGNAEFDLYVNGEMVAEDRGFNGFPLGTTTSMLQFFLWNSNRLPAAYVDDIKIIDLDE